MFLSLFSILFLLIFFFEGFGYAPFLLYFLFLLIYVEGVAVGFPSAPHLLLKKGKSINGKISLIIPWIFKKIKNLE
jgi:hypothetical protein